MYQLTIRKQATDLAMVTIKLDHTNTAIQHWTLHAWRKLKQPSNIQTT